MYLMLPWDAWRKASMNYKAIAIVILLVCVAAGWHKMTARPEPVEELLSKPDSVPAGSRGGVLQFPNPPADPSDIRQPGRINVITYYSDSCPGSRQLGAYIGHLSRMRPDAAFQMVNVSSRRDCGIELTSTPHVMIYATDGALLAADSGDSKEGVELLCDWLNRQASANAPRGST